MKQSQSPNPEGAAPCGWAKREIEELLWVAKFFKNCLMRPRHTDDPEATETTQAPMSGAYKPQLDFVKGGVANPDRVPLKDMSEADRLEIARAWAAREPIWYFEQGRAWKECGGENLFGFEAYTTIDPAEPEVELDHPWEWLRDDIEWIAMDEDGEWRGHWCSEKEPYIDGSVWLSDKGYDVLEALKLDNKGLHWTKTLRRRPSDARGPV